MAARDEMAKIGGPAFPQEWDDKCGTKTIWHGISARDYFAAAAMQGMISDPEAGKVYWKDLAEEAYEAADAMLAARKRKEG